MQFKELVDKYKFSDIKELFLKLYPDHDKSIDGFEFVLEKLKKIKPQPSDMKIIIEEIKDGLIEDLIYANVSGIKPESDLRWAIEDTPWHQWLDMGIDETTFEKYNEKEILCHCVWEMTWFGFNQESIKDKSKYWGYGAV